MKHSRSSLFLMELIIAILFFSLASTVCIRLFSKAHLLGIQTINENHAVIQAQNLAEIFYASQGNLAEMELILPDYKSDTPDNSFVLCFDKNWENCNASEAYYEASLTAFPEEDGLIKADISVYSLESAATPIYTLNILHHSPERRGTLEE